MSSEDATKRLMSKKQTLDDAYAAPANFLEIDVINPITHGVGAKRYTDYEVRMKVFNTLNTELIWHLLGVICAPSLQNLYKHLMIPYSIFLSRQISRYLE